MEGQKRNRGIASSATVYPVAALSNGVYSVVDVYREYDGSFRALLVPSTETSLDTFDMTINLKTFGKTILLVDIGTMQVIRKFTENTSSGLAVVEIHRGKKIIRNLELNKPN